MPHPKGAILTERDRALLAYVGVARYASAEQVHWLFFAGSSRKQTYRQAVHAGKQAGRGCVPAAYRVWVVAGPEAPWLRPPAARDIGHRFLEHTLLLNEVLAGLVLALRASPAAPLGALPFRWLSEEDEQLEFQILQRQTHQLLDSVLKPDAILEIPVHHRRLFLEAETGTQSITTAHPGRNGAVFSKLGRYAQYFCSYASAEGDATWYWRAFPDRYFPTLVFIVHSDERKVKVLRAVKECGGSSASSRFDVLALTFAEAPAVLAPYIAGGRLGSLPVHKPPRVLTLDVRTVQRIRDGYNALADGMNAARRALHERNENPRAGRAPLPPVDTEAIRAFRELIQREILADVRAAEASSGKRNDGSGAGHGGPTGAAVV